jgi:hypothetical protein
MFKYKRTTLLFLSALAVAVTAAITALRAQSDDGSPQVARGAPEQGRQDIKSKLPVVDFDAPELSGGDEQKTKRRAKSKTYNEPGGLRGRRHPLLNADVAALHTEWDWGLESALPAAQSSAVVVGEVVDAKAHLSEDRINVYMEFTVRVGEVNKNDPGEPVAVGDLIAADREGGRVRVPSGRVATFRVSGQGVPEAGKRYVFFLGFNRREAMRRGLTDPREMNRHLLTAYELRDGKVFPLDYTGSKNFDNYKGRDETAFLNEIRSSVASSSQASPK